MMVDVPAGQMRWLSECSVVRFDDGYHFFVLDDEGRPQCTVTVHTDPSLVVTETALGQALWAVLSS